jgi:peptidoglycan hydrolase-like protein with peptidoglycan-binding domain
MLLIGAMFVALPALAGAQSTSVMPEGQASEGYLIPKGAHPREPSSDVGAMPEQDAVRQAQMALREAGFDPGTIDGVMGPKTQAALREFQASHGLPQTGRLDSTTQQQLLSARMPGSSGSRDVPPRTSEEPLYRDPSRPGVTTPGSGAGTFGR